MTINTLVNIGIFRSLLFLGCSVLTAWANGVDGPNLVPEMPAKHSPHYWCTWYAQNYWQLRGGEITDFDKLTNLGAQEEMNHHHIFNEKDGWAHYMKRGREDLTFLIDHGWQLRQKDWSKESGTNYFNFIADPADFPQYDGMTPPQQMKARRGFTVSSISLFDEFAHSFEKLIS